MFFPDMLKLKEIFLTETEAALEDALQFSINVEDAIETPVKKTAGQYQYKVMMCFCNASVTLWDVLFVVH